MRGGREEESRSRCSMAGGSARVSQRACVWPGCVATYRRGGYVAQTLALRVAQVQAVPFSSDNNSLAFGWRLRWYESKKDVPVHWLPASDDGAFLPRNQ